MMHYTFQSQPIKPIPRIDPKWGGTPEQYRDMAKYLASINLSASEEWQYPLKTLPRPTGRATRVIVTEYDLPRPVIEPHDVILDKKGIAWYTDFDELEVRPARSQDRQGDRISDARPEARLSARRARPREGPL